MHNLHFLQKRFPRLATPLAVLFVGLSLVATALGVGIFLHFYA